MVRLDDQQIQAALEPVPEAWTRVEGLRRAAVLCPLVRREGVDHLLFTLRPDDLPQHAGQVSFPGGGAQGSESPAACALREGQEEIGLSEPDTLLLGALPPMTSSSAYHVHTLVGRVEQLDFLADPREVAEILWVPVADLLPEDAFEERSYESRGRRYRPTPHFEFGAHTIWGLTGLLTQRLMARLRART